MGGFHVSGCIAMLPTLPADLQEALDLGIHLFAGKAEGRMAELLCDVAHGTAKPIYKYLNDLPEMAAAVHPILPREVVTRVAGHYSSFDAGRGCPFQCSFCTIINVQGRKSRYRTPDNVEAIVRANAAQGVTRFFVTDDNFARNRNWEPILDRLIELREREKFKIRLILQVDTLCHRILGFIEKAARAGCNAVFIGLENINSVEFLYPTPLPGSEDHKNLYTRGVPEAWMRTYADAWKRYYTDEHVETILRRAVANGLNPTKILDAMMIFSGSSRIEGVHPLQFGLVRHKVRTRRRYGMPIVNPLVFYPWRAFDFLKVAAQWLRLVRRYRRIMARVVADPASRSYIDEALHPYAGRNEPDHLVEMFADKIPKTHDAPVQVAV
jgi:hypothetical protein